MRTVACGMLLGLVSVLGVFHWPAAAQRNGNAVGIPSNANRMERPRHLGDV